MNVESLIKLLNFEGFLHESEINDKKKVPLWEPLYENSPTKIVTSKKLKNSVNPSAFEDHYPKNLNDRDYEDWEGGIDMLAWYVPFHESLERWGIYIRARGIEILAMHLVSAGVPWISATSHAFNLLLAHELGHYKAEVLVSTHEISEARHFYLSGARRAKLESRWNHSEEAICSSLAYHETSGFRKQTRTVLDNAPDGYNNWRSYDMSNPENSWGELLGLYLSGAPLHWASIEHAQADLEYSRLRQIKMILDGSGPSGGVAGNASLSA